MEYINYIIIAILLLFIIQRMLPAKDVKQVALTDLKDELNNNGKQFIDVRTPGEFKGNHIKGFKNIPLHQLPQKADQEFAKDMEVIVSCQSGMRSWTATVLRKL